MIEIDLFKTNGIKIKRKCIILDFCLCNKIIMLMIIR
jgi:hypothetical protein